MSKTSNFSRIDVIKQQINAKMEGVYTMLPAIVKSYDSTTQTVDVQFAVSQNYYLNEVATPAPIVRKVPVMFPFGDNFRMGWTLKAGDNVMLIFSMRSLEEYKGGDGNKPVVPFSKRRHSSSDIIAIAGMLPTPTRDENYKDNTHIADSETYIVFNPNEEDGLLIKTDKKVKVESSDDVVVETPKNVNVTCNFAKVTAPNAEFSGNLKVAGNLRVGGKAEVVGDVIGQGKSLATHVHAHGIPNTSAPI